MSKNTTDELDDILLSHHTCICETDTPTSFRSHQLFCIQNYNDTKKAIQAHIDKRVNEVLGELNKEIFFSSANPDGQLLKNIILNKRQAIKQLRSEL